MKILYIINSGAVIGAALILYYIKKRCGGPSCRCSTRLEGKVAIITGATSGIGLVVAKQLACKGATIILAVRNLHEGLKIQENLKHSTLNSKIICKSLDLNDFASIHSFVNNLTELNCGIDLLINNAGVFFHPPEETIDKFDVTFQTNYLGHFLLTELLIDSLNPDCRVIFVSSAAHFMVKSLDVKTLISVDRKEDGTYARFLNYANSKLCLLLYSKNLALRLAGRRINIFSVDPGSVETPIYRHFPLLRNPLLKAIQKPIRFFVIRSPLQGAQTILHCAVSPHLKHESGLYYANLGSTPSSILSLNNHLSTVLYENSRIWTNLK